MGVQSRGFLWLEQIGETLGLEMKGLYSRGGKLRAAGGGESGLPAWETCAEKESAVCIHVMEGAPLRWVPREGAGQGLVRTKE